MGIYAPLAQTIKAAQTITASVLLLLMCLTGCEKVEKPAAQPSITQLPEIPLTSMNGSAVPLRSLQGKVLVLNIWATWCPGCRAEMPSLQQLSKSVDAEKISIVGITIDQDVHLAKEFIKQTGVTFRNFSDPQGQAANALGIRVYPETLIVDKDGTILYRVFGAIDWHTQDIQQSLNDLANGKHPALQNKLPTK